MTSLAERSKIIVLKFLYKLVNVYLNFLGLLSFLNFNHVPVRRTSSSNTFYIPFQGTNNTLCSPINKLMRLANDVYVDLFYVHSIECFSSYITNYL